MSPLQTRKQLLIAESEINRAHLAQDWQTIKDDAYFVTRRARMISSLAFTGASLISGLVSFRRNKSARAAEKLSLGLTLLKCAHLAKSVWQEFQPFWDGKKQ